MPATACRLYLVAPDPLPADFATQLRAALAAGDVAALRLATNDEAVVAEVRPITRAFDVALILDGPPALAARTGCDGAHVRDVEQAAAARRALGDLQLGVFCADSRDAAMRAGEAGADYVAFGPVAPTKDAGAVEDAISWWADLMEPPVVAEGPITAANCAALVRAGADFLAPVDGLWNDPAGPAAAVAAIGAAIATLAADSSPRGG
jgi:thiamine-phosphate pyrophosphorylase